MSAIYKGLLFRTALEARWASFFDLAGWEWHTNVASVGNWQPDFFVKFRCDHSECGGFHSLLVSVLPLSNISEFMHHPCLSHCYGVTAKYNGKEIHVADGGAAFGANPNVTQWQIGHGSGGGVEDVHFRVHNAYELWEKANSFVDSFE